MMRWGVVKRMLGSNGNDQREYNARIHLKSKLDNAMT